MIAIPNMDKPKFCDDCFVPLSKCEYFAKDGIDHCPLIDIVQCKDCKWSYIDDRDGTLWCKVHMSHYRVNSDGFCSYGERRMIWEYIYRT